MKPSELLRAAKAHIHPTVPYGFFGPDEPTPYICCALTRAAEAAPLDEVEDWAEAEQAVKQRVLFRLDGGRLSFGVWLLYALGKRPSDLGWLKANGAHVQKHRLAWMEQMAQEFEEEGQ